MGADAAVPEDGGGYLLGHDPHELRRLGAQARIDRSDHQAVASGRRRLGHPGPPPARIRIELRAGFGDATPTVRDMSNASRTESAPAGFRRAPSGLVAALTTLSWFGMIVHDRISLPDLSLLDPQVVLPTSCSWPCSSRGGHGRDGCSFWLLFGWTLLHFAVGGILSVLPLPFLPFVPEQTLRHYVAHALYAAFQVPLLIVLFRLRPGRVG